MKRRITSFLVCLAMLYDLASPFAIQSSAQSLKTLNSISYDYTYSPAVLKRPVLSNSLCSATNIIGSSGFRATPFNLGNSMYFNLGMAYPELATSSEGQIMFPLTHTLATSVLGSTRGNFLRFYFGSEIEKLASTNQLSFGYSLAMASDKYSAFRNTCYLRTSVFSNVSYAYNVTYDTYNKASGVWADYGSTSQSNDFNNIIPTNATTIDLTFVKYNSENGSPNVDRVALYLADKKTPKLSGVDISNTEAAPGEEIIITLQFSENIRLSDNNFIVRNSQNNAVKLALLMSYNNTEVKDSNEYAYLNSISGNEVKFKYIVPNKIGNVETNHKILGIKGYNEQSDWCNANSEFSLKYPYEGAPNYWMDFLNTSDAYYSKDVWGTKTLFTDLAGNPVDTFNAYSFINGKNCTMDGLPPTIKSVTAKNSQLHSTGNNNSKVFAGVGDIVNLEATLSEAAKYTDNTIIAKLNVLDEDGKNIELGNLKNPGEIDNIYSTTVKFSPLTITDKMKIDTDETPIKIISVRINKQSGLYSTDRYGNSMIDSSTVPNPDTELRIDTLGPQISYGEMITNTNDKFYFCIPVNISDDITNGEYSASGITAISGTYRWDISPYNVDYSVLITGSPTVPEDVSWQNRKSSQAYSFQQTGTEQFIHIKINNTRAYSFDNISFAITASDYAGNGSSKATVLPFYMDFLIPSISMGAVTSENTGKSYNLSSTISMSDNKEIDKSTIQYQFVANRTNLDDNGWLSLGDNLASSAEIVEETTSSATVNMKLKELPSGFYYKYNLHIKAKDNSGNESYMNFPFEYNLESPALMSITDGEKIQIKRSNVNVSVSQSNTSANFVLIENPYDIGKYLMRYCTYGYVEGSGYVYNFNESNQGIIPNDLADWDTYSKEWSYVTFEKANSSIQDTCKFTPAGEFLVDILQKLSDADYYGNIKTITVSGYNITADNLPEFTDPVSISEQEIRVTPDFVDGKSTLPALSLTPIGWEYSPETNWTIDDFPKARYNTTMDGKEIEVAVEGVIDAWELSDMEGLTLQLCNFPLNQAIWETEIKDVTKEKITIPSGYTTDDGEYYIKLIAKPKQGNDYELVTPRINIKALKEVTDFKYNGATHRHYANGLVHDTNIMYIAGEDVLIGRQEQKTTYLSFSAYQESNDTVYIKAWTEAEIEHNIENLPWIEAKPSTDNNVYVSYSAVYEGIPQHTDIEYERHELLLNPNSENTIHYQLFTQSGYLSEVRSFKVEASDEMACLEVGITPEDDGYAVHNVEAYVKKLESKTLIGDNTSGILNPFIIYDDKDGFYSKTDVFTDGKFNITKGGDYHFAVVNPYGNYTISTVSANHVDNEKPTLTMEGYNNSISMVYSDLRPISDWNQVGLYLKYSDEEYMKKLVRKGLVVNDEGYFKVELPSGYDTYHLYQPKSFNSGIYQVYIIANTIELVIAGCYDSGKETESILSKGVQGYVIDGGGNISYICSSDSFNITNTKPYFLETMSTGANQQNPEIQLRFSQPIDMTYPGYKVVSTQLDDRKKTVKPNAYSFNRDGFPAYGNGTYDIQFNDIFAQEYEEKITIGDEENDYFADKSIDVTPSTLESNAAKYSIYLKSKNDDIKFYFSGYYEADTDLKNAEYSIIKTDGTDVEPAEYFSEATVSFKTNGVVAVWIGNDSVGWTQRLIHCYNLSEAAEVKANANFHGDVIKNGGNNETYEDVTVSISTVDSDRSIFGDGAPLEHTFSYGSETTHTFYYTDDQGFRGSYEYILSDDHIVLLKPTAPPEPIVDTTAPIYEVMVYGNYANAYKHIDTVSPEENFQSMVNTLGYVKNLMLELKVSEQSNYKSVILPYGSDANGLTYKSAKSTSIENVIITDNFIKIMDENAAFAIAVVDENDNISKVIQVNGGFKFDNIAPTIEDIKIEQNGYSSSIVYVKVSDDSTPLENIILRYPVSAELITNNADKYHGYFKYNASNNGSVEFSFKDEAGNIISKEATVSGINNTLPVGKIQFWSPSSLGNKLAPASLTNKNVSVEISFDKYIKELTIDTYNQETDSYINTDEKSSPAKIVFCDGYRGVIEFNRSGKVRLNYTAITDKKGVPIILDMNGTIDKLSPTVEINSANDYISEYTKAIGAVLKVFSYSEPLVIDGAEYTAERPFEKVIYQNGKYAFRCFDLAGNLTNKVINVDFIDNTAPILTLSGVPTTGLTNTNVKFNVTINEPGEIVLGAGLTTEDNTVIKGINGGSITASVSQNGYYSITAIDEAGRRTTQYINIGTIDKTAPIILAKSSSKFVRQDTSLQTLIQNNNEFFLDGLQIRDNKSENQSIVTELDISGITQDNLNTVGVYPFSVIATDEAGNTAVSKMYVKVFSKYQTQVNVNGENVENNGVATVQSNDSAHLTISLPNGYLGEPYSVYMAEGYLTQGQMKKNSEELVLEDGINELEIDTSPDTWYTVYIVRQSREVFLLRIYSREQ